MQPIANSDLRCVAEFLHLNHAGEISADRWLEGLEAPWAPEGPNRGFMLVTEEGVVGVHLAYYSVQEIRGRRERFCNLGTWCVLVEHRTHSLRLLRALLAQDEFTFTDLTPSPDVAALDRRLGFQPLDTAAALVPCLPLPHLRRRAGITSDRARIERKLAGRDLSIYRDHTGAAGAVHIVIEVDGGYCYVVARRGRWRKLPVATVLYASDRGLLREQAGLFARHLLVRHRVVAYLAEQRVTGAAPTLSARLHRHQPRFFRSERLRGDDIGYLYSELACLSW